MKPAGFEECLAELRGATEELRAAARSADDPRRCATATWLEQMLSGVTDREGLRQASQRALTLFQGGMGSFSDVDYTTGARAIGRLWDALQVSVT